MRRTTVITVACLTATALTLTACGRDSGNGGSGAAQTGAAVSTGKATGTITVWAMGAEGEKLPELAKEFESANPGVKVNVTAIPWDAAHDKFTTAITANKTPDLAMVGTTWMGEFAGMGALDPTPGSIDTSAFFDGAQKTTEVNGTSYGIPWYVETRVVFYRSDLAKKAGYDSVPGDWQGLHDMAKAMQTKAGAKWGIGLQAGGTGSWQSIMPFAWSDGASLTKDDGSYNFDSPEMLNAVKYYQSYFTDGISNKAAPATPTTEPDFASGKVPMFISGPWMMSAVEKVGGAGFKDKYNVAPIPAGSAGSSSFVGGSNLAVFKNTQNRDTAWKFVEWLADPKTQVKWYSMSTDLPSVKSAWNDPSLASDPKLAVFGKQLETAKAPPSYPTWEQVIANFDTQMEKVTKTGADPAAALKTVQQQADSIGTGQ
jgi:multiple sugar transport system substrate-binding protein